MFNGFKLFVESVAGSTVYIDSCVWSRHQDLPNNERIRKESEALNVIVRLVMHGEINLVFSQALLEELSRFPELIQNASALSKQFVARTSEVNKRAKHLYDQGLGMYDALHVASAEAARADFLVTSDDQMIRKAKRIGTSVRLVNPAVLS